MMRIISSIEEIKILSQQFPHQKLGFVPTMGAIHEGHLSLIKKAQAMTDKVVVSIFVNPLQFNQKEDFDKYPRDIEKDQDLLKKAGVDILFTPHQSDIFEDKVPKIKFSIPSFENTLCAPSRPGHFEGVLFIVYSFLSWLKPDVAVFGLKDYQQYLYIKIMSKELNLSTEIVGGATIREFDGLAMSSRNERLSPRGRKDALVIYDTFMLCQKKWNQAVSIKELQQINQRKFKNKKVDYVNFYSPENLQPIKEAYPSKALLATAVWFEGVRLIDNIMLIR